MISASTGSVISEPAVRSVLAEGRQAYLAVPAKRGPHATPALYGATNGRLGMWVANATLKARVLRRDSGPELDTGVLVRTPTAAAVISGRIRMYDPLWPPVNPARHFEAAVLTASFATRNVSDLAGFAFDALRGRAGLPPGRRVLIVMEPAAAVVVSARGMETYGGISGSEGPTSTGAYPGPAHVAVMDSPYGLLPVPAEWRPEEQEIRVARALIDIWGIRLGNGHRVSVVEDDYVAPGPAAKRGRLIFGTSDPAEGDAEGCARFTFRPDSASAWSGIETHTTRIS